MTFTEYRNLRFAFLAAPSSFNRICREQNITKEEQKVLIRSFKANGHVPAKKTSVML